MASAMLICGAVHPQPGPDPSSSTFRVTNRQNRRSALTRFRDCSNVINVDLTNKYTNHVHLQQCIVNSYPKGISDSHLATAQRHNITISHLNVRSLKSREHFIQIKDLIDNSDSLRVLA